jgi:hypothetical protein
MQAIFGGQASFHGPNVWRVESIARGITRIRFEELSPHCPRALPRKPLTRPIESVRARSKLKVIGLYDRYRCRYCELKKTNYPMKKFGISRLSDKP